jgi:transcription elongation factor Elf1
MADTSGPRMSARVDVDSVEAFRRLMEKNRPCPECGSERVTVRRELGTQGHILRVACSDCSFAREFPEP